MVRRLFMAPPRTTGATPLRALRLSMLPVASALAFGVLLGFAGARGETVTARGYLIDVWQSERGLPQNTVTGIAQTPDGYLWISTLDGLARFDGASFKMFKAGNTPALGSGRIRFLFPGRWGSLWLATQEGGVIRLAENRFSPLTLPEAKGVRPASVQAVEDEAGRLWLSSEDGKVWRWAQGLWSEVSTNWGLPGPAQVRADSSGRAWVVAGDSLCRLENERALPVVTSPPGKGRVLSPSRAGGWWLGAEDQLRLWREGSCVATATNPGLTITAITCCLEDHHGQVWLGTAADGLYRTGTNHEVLHISRREGLGSNSIRVLYEDNEGNLWVGTEGGGLSRLRLPLFTVYGAAQGLSSERITSVSPGAPGELWVGTDGYGLNRLGGEVARLASDDPAMPTLRVGAVLADHRGRVWLGVRSGGLWEGVDGRFISHTNHGLDRFPTRCLFEDAGGAVWVGQRNVSRLVRVQEGAFSTVALPTGLGLVDVRVISQDAAGAYWIGTDGQGLLRWQNGQFKQYTREHGLSSPFVWALCPEPDGSLWVGTYGGGLNRIKDGHVVACTTRQGLVDDVICHIADDGRGQLWFSSNQGVFRVAKRELNQFADGHLRRVQCVAYGKSDGLPALECEGGCRPAGCQSRDGRLWFPTIRGLVAVNPAEVSTNPAAPPVFLEELRVDGVATELTGVTLATCPRAGVGTRAPDREPLRVAPGQRRFEFHYTGLDFSAPERLRFRHKLVGVDAEWVETGDQREASYNQLPRGSYTFRVQACNREGIWNQTGDELAFVVSPYYWQTPWFIGGFLATFGGTVGWTVSYALRRRHQRHVNLLQRLHALERDRIRIARDIHDDLGSSLTEISLLGALAARETTSPAEAREQLTRIMNRAEELARKLDETVWAVNPNNDTLRHLATYLCNLMKEFLEPTSIRCRLEVADVLPDVPLDAEVRHNVFLVVKEALNNAVRHAQPSEIWLRMAAVGQRFTIEVTDNGSGFAPLAPRAGGNGLRNMAERMQEVGGQLEVRQASPRGITVWLYLPLPPSELTQLREGNRRSQH